MHQWIWPWGELYPVDHLYSIAPQYLDWYNFKCLEIVALNWKGLKASPLSSTGKRCFLHTDLMDLMTTRNKLHWSPTVEDWADLSCFFIFSNNWLMREIYLCMPSYPKLTFTKHFSANSSFHARKPSGGPEFVWRLICWLPKVFAGQSPDPLCSCRSWVGGLLRSDRFWWFFWKSNFAGEALGVTWTD